MKIKSIKKNGVKPTWDLSVPNEQHYITKNGCVSHNTSQILGNNECFTEGHEILTNEGWVDFKNITEGTKVAQVDYQNGMGIDFVNPTSLIKKEIEEDVYKIFNDGEKINFSVEVTKGHDLIIKDDVHSDWYKIKAQDLTISKNHIIPLTGKLIGGKKELSLEEKFRLLVHQLGVVNKRGFGKELDAVVFSLTEEIKVFRLNSLLNLLGYEYTLFDKIEDSSLIKQIVVKVPTELKVEKNLNWVLMDEISQQWIVDFFDEITHWSGWVDYSTGAYKMMSNDKVLIDKIQFLGVLGGFYCSINEQENQWLLNCVKVSERNIANLKIEKKHYKGNVYCVSVPTGAIIVRKDNCVTVIGNCFEPFTSNSYLRRTLSGEFPVVNKHLVKDLEELNLWSQEMSDKIVAEKGSIQNIPEIPTHLKELYKTVWEIKMKDIIDMSADRGAFIDQSQSLNLFIKDCNPTKLTNAHFYGWLKGLKTGMYYLRTQAAVDANASLGATTHKATEKTEEKLYNGKRLEDMTVLEKRQYDLQNDSDDGECLACGS